MIMMFWRNMPRANFSRRELSKRPRVFRKKVHKSVVRDPGLVTFAKAQFSCGAETKPKMKCGLN